MKGKVLFNILLVILLLLSTKAKAITESVGQDSGTEEVPYIGSDGKQHTTTAVVLTENTTEINEGWYVVNSDITIQNTLVINGTVNLILADGCTAEVGKWDELSIEGSNANLNIYGQTKGTGVLAAVSSSSYYSSESIFINGTFAIYGGKWFALSHPYANDFSMSVGIVDLGGYQGFVFSNTCTITGGQVSNSGYYSFTMGETLTLGCTSAADFIQIFGGILSSSSYSIKIAEGQTLTDGTFYYDDQTPTATLAALKKVTLRREFPVSEVDIPALTYTGEALTPSVYHAGSLLVVGKNYEIAPSESNYVNVGTYSVIITGKDNLIGEEMKSFTIAPKILMNQNITLSVNEITYTGSTIEPEVTVTDGEKTLVEGTDYTVEYSNNINVGTGKVTVSFKGNYGGEVVKEFTIKPVPEIPENTENHENTENTATATDDISVNSNVKIWSFEKTIFVENASKEIVIVDMAGRIVKSVKPENSRIEIQLSNSGVYIVKTGLKTQKIIIQ